MLKLRDIALPRSASAQLEAYQQDIDAAGDYSQRVAFGKQRFGQVNIRSNTTFKSVKSALDRMCSGARRCCYCEDSVADEVEHIWPKDLYPERVFRWSNYLYACGPCNGPKNNKFAVLRDGLLVTVTRRRGSPIVEPLAGDPALVDPRVEDAAEFFDLDLLGTFLLLPQLNLSPRNLLRAEFTSEILDLNRDVLLAARENAYQSYRARIYEYWQKRDGGASTSELDALRSGLKAMPHPTVWHEMKRRHALVPELAALFGEVPEALGW